MLRQHVYYSITFIPGQFTPDIWNVDLTKSIKSYDSVSIINSDTWEVPEKLWHRNTLFVAGVFSESSIETDTALGNTKINSFIAQRSETDIDGSMYTRILNSTVPNESELDLTEIANTFILQTFTHKKSDLSVGIVTKSDIVFNSIVNTPSNIAGPYMGFSTIYTLALHKSDVARPSVISSTAAFTYVKPNLEQNETECKSFGKISFQFKNLEIDPVSVKTDSDNMLYVPSTAGKQNKTTYLRGIYETLQ